MSKHTHHDDEIPDSPVRHDDVHHEMEDVNPTPVYKFLFWLGVFTALTYVIVYFIMRPAINETNAPSTQLVAKSKMDRLPPEPRLQLAPGHVVHPIEELRGYRDSLMTSLDHYGYVDQKAGVVHIPIERAKELIAQRGLPTSAQPGAADPSVVMVPSAWSSGRMLVPLHTRIPGRTMSILESMPRGEAAEHAREAHEEKGNHE